MRKPLIRGLDLGFVGGFGLEIPPAMGPLGRPASRTAAVDVATVLTVSPMGRFPKTWTSIVIIANRRCKGKFFGKENCTTCRPGPLPIPTKVILVTNQNSFHCGDKSLACKLDAHWLSDVRPSDGFQYTIKDSASALFNNNIDCFSQILFQSQSVTTNHTLTPGPTA